MWTYLCASFNWTCVGALLLFFAFPLARFHGERVHEYVPTRALLSVSQRRRCIITQNRCNNILTPTYTLFLTTLATMRMVLPLHKHASRQQLIDNAHGPRRPLHRRHVFFLFLLLPLLLLLFSICPCASRASHLLLPPRIITTLLLLCLILILPLTPSLLLQNPARASERWSREERE